LLEARAEGRFSEKPLAGFFGRLKKRDEVTRGYSDLRDFPMPFFDQPVTPATPGRPLSRTRWFAKWTAAIGKSDASSSSPRIPLGPSAVLKNAIAVEERHRKVAQIE